MDRFWAKVDRTDGCWLWIAATDPLGYGRFRLDGRTVLAHRLAYELLVGPIPEGLVLDHLCRTPGCVNPAHLEPVTHAENIRRGDLTQCGALEAARTHCPQGHEYSAGNTYVTKRGSRTCRACGRARAHRNYHQNR